MPVGFIMKFFTTLGNTITAKVRFVKHQIPIKNRLLILQQPHYTNHKIVDKVS